MASAALTSSAKPPKARHWLGAAISALAMAAPIQSHAEPQPAVQELMFYMDKLPACLDAAATPEDARACGQIGAQICMEREEGGFTTLGMMFCTLAEAEAWDIELNRVYGDVMAGLRRLDADEGEAFAAFAVRADRLRDAQRAWIALRDGDCALAYAMWGSGSMRNIAGASCRLEQTMERTIFLKFLTDGML